MSEESDSSSESIPPEIEAQLAERPEILDFLRRKIQRMKRKRLQVQAIQEEIRDTKENIKQEREKLQEAKKRAKQWTTEGELMRLSEAQTLLCVEFAQWSLSIPDDHIDVSAIEDEVETLVRDFSTQLQQGESIERSHSIHEKNSLHHLWIKILKLLARVSFTADDDSKANNDDTRHAFSEAAHIVHRCKASHAISGEPISLDFAFIPTASSFFNWSNARCVLQLNLTNISENESFSESSQGSVMSSESESEFVQDSITTDDMGLLQTLNRAAMCVLSRWKKVGCTGAHFAVCCYADSRQFGVVRVSISEDYTVRAEMTEKWILPGIDTTATRTRKAKKALAAMEDNNNRLKPLIILSHLLLSPLSELEKGGWNSLYPAEVSVDGFDAERSPASWGLGTLLGCGGFAQVFSEVNYSSRAIEIKRASRQQNGTRDYLASEYEKKS